MIPCFIRTAARHAASLLAGAFAVSLAYAQASQTLPVVPAPVPPRPSLQKWIKYPAAPKPLSPQAMLGKQIFFDATLSGSGKMSCASCHSPEHAYGPPNGLAVQLGGPDLKRSGVRAVPSLRYMAYTPHFTTDYFFPSSENSEDEGPAGGFLRDGSVASLHEQAAHPMLDPNEMANTTRAEVAGKVRRSAYAATFRQVFGEGVFDDPNKAFDSVGLAIEAFETEDMSFHPYTSKFDAVMSGHADFTPQELRGYALYNDPMRGNCAKCHFDQPGPDGRPAQFTDYQYIALGVPRNPEIPANRDPRYFDMGLCGPYRKDLAKQTNLCGLFKDPTLRNVTTRHVFFHNGRFHSIEDVLHFYFERDIHPEKSYPRRNGKLVVYDDLPPAYRDDVDRLDPPFFGQRPGRKPALSEADIRDLVAFLKTLNDGYSDSPGGQKAGGAH
ncbi:cytochrome-c peroxidase [Paraburkholderia lycopersici]|uniref:Cytochrome c peroxidase n=1 Tax=Paraburkholderia lycopersici TaxID=416944 RepID=A0A1G6YT01_9BURK|nr:cytochrome c peroxidase [Paraburkholderia lycopersici]SDD92777.1 cytochrome c peroxidase [Paraburkholderia lycopersici]